MRNKALLSDVKSEILRTVNCGVVNWLKIESINKLKQTFYRIIIITGRLHSKSNSKRLVSQIVYFFYHINELTKLKLVNHSLKYRTNIISLNVGSGSFCNHSLCVQYITYKITEQNAEPLAWSTDLTKIIYSLVHNTDKRANMYLHQHIRRAANPHSSKSTASWQHWQHNDCDKTEA